MHSEIGGTIQGIPTEALNRNRDICTYNFEILYMQQIVMLASIKKYVKFIQCCHGKVQLIFQKSRWGE